MALQFERKRDAIQCFYCDRHQSIAEIFVDAHALVRTNGSSNPAKLGEQLRSGAVAKALGVIREP
jgi:hypothetical protein